MEKVEIICKNRLSASKGGLLASKNKLKIKVHLSMEANGQEIEKRKK